MSPSLSFTFSTLCSPSPAACFTMCTSWCADLPSPHHNQLSRKNVIGLHRLSCHSFTDTHCWWPAGLFNVGHIPCPKTSGTNYLSIIPEE
jgi:hypothetical protein